MKIRVKSYHVRPHHVEGHHVSGYLRKVPGTNRSVRIGGHHRSGHHRIGHLVPMHVRASI